MSHKFGLIGKNIDYSFSRGYFSKKFENEGFDHSYENFDLADISEFESVLKVKDLKGLNVTIPYKEAIIPYLDSIHKKATKIGAVNTIKITKKGKLKGYNTDYYGFKKSLEPLLKSHHDAALILGTGGASKAIKQVLKKLGIVTRFVSRNAGKDIAFTYDTLTDHIIEEHNIIVNCTPLGTYPNIEAHPNIPYQGITSQHLVYDLIYNPEVTTFLKKSKKEGAVIQNGLRMLQLQAEKSWEIWQS
ncbi:MAG: shikimate dehydrogenase family protein [bacterium]